MKLPSSKSVVKAATIPRPTACSSFKSNSPNAYELKLHMSKESLLISVLGLAHHA